MAVTKYDLFDSMSAEVTVPQKPKAGFVYLFKWSDNESKENDWRADGYRWRQSGHFRPLKSSTQGTVMHLRFYVSVNVYML